jgi:hypothetical protein
VPVQVISLFNEFELEQILCGLGEINVDDWRKHAVMIGSTDPSPSCFLRLRLSMFPSSLS